MVEPIGAYFKTAQIEGLSARFSGREAEGWKLHSTFSVAHKTCLLLAPTTTYLAVYEWVGVPANPYPAAPGTNPNPPPPHS